MSDEKKKKSGSKRENRFIGDSAIYEYTKRPLIFVAIAMVVAIIIAFVTIRPLSALVHRVENVYNISAGDVVIDKDKLHSIDEATLGQAVARLTIADRGVNTTVFYGLNRASMREGVGLSVEYGFFADDSSTFISGYDETELASLKNLKKDDVIRIKTADKLMSYKVVDTHFASGDWRSVKADNKLVIFSVFSDFSSHSGESFYVIADKVSEEAIADE